MTDIQVSLIDKMGDDLSVVNAARVSFRKQREDLGEGDIKLLSYLASHEHTSPFRHTQLSIRCRVPVFLARQLAKHQAGLSWNEVSRRYIDNGFEFYNPRLWRARPLDGIKQGSGAALQADVSDSCGVLLSGITSQCYNTYKLLLGLGVSPEEARMVLPQNMMVDFIWTGNLLAFYHVYKLRSKPEAQTVARDFADKLGEILEETFPQSFKALQENVK